LPIEELASLGEAAVEPLIQVLRKSDGAKLILWDVVHTLALIKGERAVEVLLETLTHPEYLARAAAREELARIGETRAIKPLLEVLAHDIELFEREGAARSLEALGWEPATGTERALRAIALGQWDAVVNIGAEAVPPVLPLLESTKRPLDEPLQALGRIGDTRALGPIMKWVMVNPDYAQCAVEVVSQILKKKPGGAAAGDLRQIARMRDPVQNEYRWCPSPDDIPWREVSGQHRVDCTELRRLALRELGAA